MQHFFLSTLLLVSVALNVFQAHRLREQADQKQLTARRLPIGTLLQPMRLQSVDEAALEETILAAAHSRPTVVYLLDGRCRWCDLNFSSVAALARQVGGDYRIVGIAKSREDGRSLAGRYASVFPIYWMPRAEDKKRIQLGATPRTLVISAQGRVLADWAGAYVEPNRSTIERFFKVKLPDLKPAGADQAARNGKFTRSKAGAKA